jgi:hypothetical protein
MRLDPMPATLQATNRQLTKRAHRIMENIVLKINHPPKRSLFLDRSPSTIKMGNAMSTNRGVPIRVFSGVPKSAAGATSRKP